MKIVIVASLAFSLVNFRRRLIADMVACGHQVLACAPEDDREVAEQLAEMGVSYRTMPMQRVGLNPLADLRTLSWLIGLVVREQPDLVLAYTQKPIIYSGIACRIARRARFFAMVSGLGHVFGEGGSRWLRLLVAQLYRSALARAEAIFVFNADDRGEMLRHRMITPAARVVQVPGSGVDLSYYRAVPIAPGSLRFLMIARLLRSKGLFEFVEAARRIRGRRPEVRFELLGPLDPSPAGIGAEQLQAWKREGVIDYLGEARDVRPYLAAASVFVLPSWYREGLPRTILEAMATGRAVVTTDMPGCREPISDGVNGFLVAPRDAGALEAALLRFVDDPRLAPDMGARGREIAEAHYSVEHVTEILLSTMHLRDAGSAQQPKPMRTRLAGAAP